MTIQRITITPDYDGLSGRDVELTRQISPWPASGRGHGRVKPD